MVFRNDWIFTLQKRSETTTNKYKNEKEAIPKPLLINKFEMYAPVFPVQFSTLTLESVINSSHFISSLL